MFAVIRLLLQTFLNEFLLISNTNNVNVAVINAKPDGVATAVNVASAYDIPLIVFLNRQREIYVSTLVTHKICSTLASPHEQ